MPTKVKISNINGNVLSLFQYISYEICYLTHKQKRSRDGTLTVANIFIPSFSVRLLCFLFSQSYNRHQICSFKTSHYKTLYLNYQRLNLQLSSFLYMAIVPSTIWLPQDQTTESLYQLLGACRLSAGFVRAFVGFQLFHETYCCFFHHLNKERIWLICCDAVAIFLTFLKDRGRHLEP